MSLGNENQPSEAFDSIPETEETAQLCLVTLDVPPRSTPSTNGAWIDRSDLVDTVSTWPPKTARVIVTPSDQLPKDDAKKKALIWIKQNAMIEGRSLLLSIVSNRSNPNVFNVTFGAHPDVVKCFDNKGLFVEVFAASAPNVDDALHYKVCAAEILNETSNSMASTPPVEFIANCHNWNATHDDLKTLTAIADSSKSIDVLENVSRVSLATSDSLRPGSFYRIVAIVGNNVERITLKRTDGSKIHFDGPRLRHRAAVARRSSKQAAQPKATIVAVERKSGEQNSALTALFKANVALANVLAKSTASADVIEQAAKVIVDGILSNNATGDADTSGGAADSGADNTTGGESTGGESTDGGDDDSGSNTAGGASTGGGEIDSGEGSGAEKTSGGENTGGQRSSSAVKFSVHKNARQRRHKKASVKCQVAAECGVYAAINAVQILDKDSAMEIVATVNDMSAKQLDWMSSEQVEKLIPTDLLNKSIFIMDDANRSLVTKEMIDFDAMVPCLAAGESVVLVLTTAVQDPDQYEEAGRHAPEPGQFVGRPKACDVKAHWLAARVRLALPSKTSQGVLKAVVAEVDWMDSLFESEAWTRQQPAMDKFCELLVSEVQRRCQRLSSKGRAVNAPPPRGD
jgi:hypothetical protein